MPDRRILNEALIAALQEHMDAPPQQSTPQPTGIPGMAGYLVGGLPGQIAGDAAEQAAEPTGRGLGEYMAGLFANLNPYGAKIAQPEASQVVAHLDPNAMLRQAAITAAMQKAQLAFHGTPHYFDTPPSTAEIGTGEGHQAFGWGLYGAKEPQVAEAYRTGLAKPEIAINGKTLPDFHGRVPESVEHYIGAAAPYGDKPEQLLGNAKSQIIDDIRRDRQTIKGFQQNLADYAKVQPGATEPKTQQLIAERIRIAKHNLAGMQEQLTARQQAYRDLDQLKPENISVRRGEIHAWDVPENHELLDYDAPLGEQPQAVRDAIVNHPFLGKIADADRTGRDIYNLAKSEHFHAKGIPSRDASSMVADAFREAGIPGLRYLDQGSRSAGNGTHNFVIWDDSKIKPIAKAGSYEELKKLLGQVP